MSKGKELIRFKMELQDARDHAVRASSVPPEEARYWLYLAHKAAAEALAIISKINMGASRCPDSGRASSELGAPAFSDTQNFGA